MMTRTKQISEARQLLKLKQVDDDDVGYFDSIEHTLNAACLFVELINVGLERDKAKGSGPTKKKVRSYLDALIRANNARNALPPDLRPLFADIDFKKHQDVCAELAAPGKPKRDDYAKITAARQARLLLKKYGHPIKTTRGGTWERLAAILYGDKSADLFNQCRKLHGKQN
jgi:hypothetical protein